MNEGREHMRSEAGHRHFARIRRMRRGVFALGVALLGTATSQAPDALAEEPSASTGAATCKALEGASAAGFGRVDKTIWHDAKTTVPAYCEVLGVMEERVGLHGQHYAINYRLNLPVNWNQRFLYTGGGGLNGFVGQATGTQIAEGDRNALAKGFAIVASDTGHDAVRNDDPARLGSAAFAFDYQARVNWGDRAIEKVAIAAKQLIARHYGHAPQHSYFSGCSNGGREGVNFAVRYPEQFDGIIAAAPGIAPGPTVIAWLEQSKRNGALARAAGQFRPDGLPDLSRAFSPGDLALVNRAVLNQCDGLDGLKDGMILSYGQCTTARVQPALRKLACSGAKTDQCLSPGQIDAMIKSYAPIRDGEGNLIYTGWPWDAGTGDATWAEVALGKTEQLPHFAAFGAQVMAGVILTPPDKVDSSQTSMLRWVYQFDLDRSLPRMKATTPEFPRSGWDIANAKNADLDAFRRHGGKMIVPHGTSDSIISIDDTVDWWHGVDRRYKGTARDFVRVFPVPGQHHCATGPATEGYDALETLVNWVEKGAAPDRIVATAGKATPWPGRTRPLCPYPSVARFVGGDPERAESFTCTPVRSRPKV